MDEKRIERIRAMEGRLEVCAKRVGQLSEACREWMEVQDDFVALVDYYYSGAWSDDREADENGEIPDDLPRGVLSEDAIYDLLYRQHLLTKELIRTALHNLEQ